MANQIKDKPVVMVDRKLTPKQEAARRRQQKRRQTQILVTGGIVAVIAVALIAIGIAVSQPTPFDLGANPKTTDARLGILDKGPADAKVVVEEYGDYQCPACRSWHESNQPKLLNDFINTNKSVRFVFKPFPFLDSNAGYRESHATAEAAYCAADQQRFWDFHDALYLNQPRGENTGYWTYNRLKELASKVNLDSNQFNSCLDTNKYRNKVTDDGSAATTLGVSSTPSFYVNGKPMADNGYETLSKAINDALQPAP